uniref:Uncharacterized protein n=1 Tax=Setaria italica TaxID=4555 RepID=K3Z1G5_SETIT
MHTHLHFLVPKRFRKSLKGTRVDINLSSKWSLKYLKPQRNFLEERIYSRTHEVLLLRSSLGCSCLCSHTMLTTKGYRKLFNTTAR